ncbi:MAG: TolC family protein [Spirochaetales bacterium]|nr:TolC family protein [Spirochaetales bacterium]
MMRNPQKRNNSVSLFFLFLLLPAFLPAEEPPWPDVLLEKVAEIDRKVYGAAERRLDLWSQEAAPPEREGALGPEDLFEQARYNNQEISLLNIERNKMLIEERGAKARRFPTVDFQTALTHIANPMDAINLTAGELGVYNLAGEEILIPPEDMTLYEGMENSQYDFKIIIEQPVFTWGKIRGAVEAAGIAAEAGALQIENKQTELYWKIYGSMHALYFIGRIEEILTLQQEAVNRLIGIAEDSYENGFILLSDVLEARIRGKELDIALVRLKTEKDNLLIDLSYTSGVEHLNLEDLDFSSLKEHPEEITLDNRETLIQASLKENPNIKLLELMKRIQALRQRITEGENYLKPDIGLHFELSYSGSRFPFLEKDWYGQNRWNLTSTIGISTTIFDGGQLMSSLLKEAQNTEAAMHQYEKGAQAIARTVIETLLKLELSLQNLEYYRLKTEQGQSRLELKQTQMESGSGSESDYLTQEIELYTDLIEYYRECITFFSGLYTLKALTGGET